MPEKSPQVFIVLLNWNNWKLTGDCLASLQNLNYDNYQIIVVDNNSGSQEKNIICTSPLKENFILIENRENLGFAGGNNVGIAYALKNSADYAMLLNNDTICEDRDFLKHLVRVAQSSQKIGIVGPKIYFWQDPTSKETPKIWFGGGRINWLKTKAFHLDLGKPEKSDQNPYVKKVDYITGCCLLIKREVLEKIGLMPEEYFLYYEDTDWCLSARHAGYFCAYAPFAWIWHKVSSTNVEFSYSYIYYHTRNGLLMAWRQSGFLKRTLVILFSLWILVKQLIKMLFNYRRDWAKPVMRGIMDFYRGKFGKFIPSK